MSDSSTAAAAAAAAQAALELAYGPLLITFCLAFTLYGIFLTQIYYYHIHYNNDGMKLKNFVGVIGILETLHTALCMHVLYDYFIQHYGDPDNGIFKIIWSIPLTILCEVIIVTMTSAFYVRRIWYLSDQKWYAIVLPILLMTARDALSGVSIFYTYHYGTWPVFNAHQVATRNIEATFAVGLAADLAITATLVYYLSSSRTGFAHTNRKIQTLVHYTVSTGALTVVVSAVVVGTVTLKNTLLFGGLVEIISKLYANSMLAMLNARKTIQNEEPSSRSGGAYQFATSIRTGTHSTNDPRITFGDPTNTFNLIDRPAVTVVPDYTKDALGGYKSASDNV
ncbi:hypothetical protein BC835DRAFT_1421765 [Cytidiella melzeri]|nr:hypothetical protein BC835DRAFT_1421765 [Cytidiella melzeri]